MRYGFAALMAGFLAVASAVPAAAAGFTPAANLDHMTLDFDSDAGRLSVWQVSATNSLNAVRATLQIHRLGEDPKWAPGTTIQMKNGDDFVSFQVVVFDRGGPFTVHMFRYHDKVQVEEQDFEIPLGLDEKLDVAIDWTAKGAVSVSARGTTYSMNLGAPVATLIFSGTTCEVEYNPLAIGRAR